jgi:hypothetical protein
MHEYKPRNKEWNKVEENRNEAQYCISDFNDFDEDDDGGDAKNYTNKVKINIKHEGISKIFRTGAAIYTAVVVAPSTGR